MTRTDINTLTKVNLREAAGYSDNDIERTAKAIDQISGEMVEDLDDDILVEEVAQAIASSIAEYDNRAGPIDTTGLTPFEVNHRVEQTWDNLHVEDGS